MSLRSEEVFVDGVSFIWMGSYFVVLMLDDLTDFRAIESFYCRGALWRP